MYKVSFFDNRDGKTKSYSIASHLTTEQEIRSMLADYFYVSEVEITLDPTSTTAYTKV